MTRPVAHETTPSVLLSIDHKPVAPIRTASGGNAVRHVFPGGLEAVATATRIGAFVQWAWFGVNERQAAGLVPGEFRDLLPRPPLMGDAGTAQFAPAWLWTDAPAR